MSPVDEHQVGITNVKEQNPDAEIRRLNAEINTLFAAKQYEAAARQVARVLLADCPHLRLDVRKFIIQMPTL